MQFPGLKRENIPANWNAMISPSPEKLLKVKYRPLEDGTFRIFAILPAGPCAGAVECKIRTVSIDSPSTCPYMAVSYCWHDPDKCFEWIRVKQNDTGEFGMHF